MWMAEGRMGPVRTLTAQLATFMWMFAMAHRDPKRAKPRPEAFDPYGRDERPAASPRGGPARGMPLSAETIGNLKHLFVKGNRP